MPDEREWQSLAEERRRHSGSEQWLDAMYHRIEEKWRAALNSIPEGVRTSLGRGAGARQSGAASTEAAETSDQPSQWTYRRVPDARRWVQDLDTHPSFGDSRFLWYVLGRPVMVASARSLKPKMQGSTARSNSYTHARSQLARSCQVLVVIYELAGPSEWIPYLASIFAPLIPVWIWGRAAAERPACRGADALWHGWKDLILPYIMGLRVPKDTLFIVCESDWCMAPEHETVLQEYMDIQQDRFVWCPPAPKPPPRPSDQPEGGGSAVGAASSQSHPAAQQGRKKQKLRGGDDLRRQSPETGEMPPRRWQWWYPQRLRRKATSADGFEPASPMLFDLVFFCNAASYHGVGELIWLSWDNDRWGRKSTPGNGSTAIALTKDGAANLHGYLILSDQPGHIDRRLTEALFTREHDDYECVRLLRESASYAWYSFGGYHSHQSGCDRKVGFRKARWGPPIQPYTRRLPERPAGDCRYHRWLCRCAPQGTAKENRIAEIDPSSCERMGMWYTYFEPELLTDDMPDISKLTDVILREIERRRPTPPVHPSPTSEDREPAVKSLL